jgi:hypothetical protein
MRRAVVCANPRLLVSLILLIGLAPAQAGAETPLEEARIRAAGIRRIESQRLVLYTDVPSSPEVDELPKVFDQAFELWCRYFSIDRERYRGWRMRGSIMQNSDRFKSTGLMPSDLPKFLNGYTRGLDCWLYNQTSAYYRRHLLLHEGVHGFMFSLVGSNAPAWYMEGMAELLATHRWQDDKLELPHFPKNAAEVSKLGRVEIIQSDVTRQRGKKLIDVLAYDNYAHLQIEPYGWSWAAAAFLDGHPRYRDRFRQLIAGLKQPHDFNSKLWKAFEKDALGLAEEWQVFTNDIDFGYDFARTAIDFTPAKQLVSIPQTVNVEADRGWQNSALALEAGKSYRLSAEGRYQLAGRPKPWICEPNGISIRYVNGQPLGVLLAAVRPENAKDAQHFLKPIVVAYGTTITPERSGTLYLKVNDSPGELHNNTGRPKVTIAPN